MLNINFMCKKIIVYQNNCIICTALIVLNSQIQSLLLKMLNILSTR